MYSDGGTDDAGKLPLLQNTAAMPVWSDLTIKRCALYIQTHQCQQTSTNNAGAIMSNRTAK